MTNLLIRSVAIFFVIAFTYLSLLFSAGVGDNINIIQLMFFFFLGVLSQLGLFLSTYAFKNTLLKFFIVVIMLPFFMLLLESTFFDASFLSRLTGSSVQIASLIAHIIGFSVYMYSFYRVVKSQYNKPIKQDK